MYGRKKPKCKYDPGATPGIPTPPLTREPMGTSGELSAGPDHLRPEVPEERAELERMGYLPKREDVDELSDFGVMDDGFGELDLRLPEW